MLYQDAQQRTFMSQERSGTVESIDTARAVANKLALHGESKDAKDAAAAIFSLCNVVTVLLGRIENLESKK
ncbi:hypothetical protein [Pseudomonas sp. lyk4-R2A-10]|uniref:hypothetical protein n=1 Tax=Pseudomonas sp. lyk4-R2A-10 TaxID=3040315 RepID=UPI002557509A|nr:hypothetical protein [Pseudomonas sp. lyk4-R2A-10]